MNRKFRYLNPILRYSFIGREAELKTRGICPYCERYLYDDGRCACERPVLEQIKDDIDVLILHLFSGAEEKLRAAEGGG